MVTLLRPVIQNGGVIEASLKADGPERSKPVRNADAKANVA
jgi:hypothetical protein